MTTTPHPLNRHLFIADNLNLLRSLDNESIDVICIDPPFAKNQTWVGSLKPSLSQAGATPGTRHPGLLAHHVPKASRRGRHRLAPRWQRRQVQRHLALGERRPRGLGPAHRAGLPGRSPQFIDRRQARPQPGNGRLRALHHQPPHRDPTCTQTNREPIAYTATTTRTVTSE